MEHTFHFQIYYDLVTAHSSGLFVILIYRLLGTKKVSNGCSAEALINGDINGEPILCSDYKILFDYFYTTGLRKFRDVLIQSKRTLEEQK